MVRLVGVLVVLTVACKSKHEPPKPAPPAPKAFVPEPVLTAEQHLGFIPDSIAVRLGKTMGIAAVDMRAFKADQLLALIPEPFACARDLLKYMGVAVVTSEDGEHFTLYATQLSEVNTKACLDQIAPALGVSTMQKPDGSYQVGAATLHWDNGVLAVHETGTQLPPPAPPDSELLAQLATVPSQAPGFLLIKRTASGPPLRLTVWFVTEADTVGVTARAEGQTAGAAHDWVNGVVGGFKDAAKEEHFAVDDSWFKVSDTGLTSTLDIRLPLNAITAAARR